MAYSSNVRGHWLFNQSLEEESNNRDFTLSSGSENYLRYQTYDLFENRTVNHYGLKLDSGTRLTAGPMFNFVDGSTYSVSLIFWYYQSSPLGFVRNVVTLNPTPKFVPIIAKANSSTASGGDEIISAGEWVVCEQAFSETQNKIAVGLCSGGYDVTHKYESEAFVPGLHLVSISYTGDGTTGRIRIDIDGERGTDYLAPESLLTTVGHLRIGQIGLGNTAHRGSVSGAILGETVLRETDAIDTDDPARMFIFGSEYIRDDEYVDLGFRFLGLSYHQPSTVTSNHIYDEGGNIYVSRSDGSIHKGSRPIWDTEFVYEDETAVSYLNTEVPTTVSGGPTHDVSWTSEGLHVEGASVRI